MKKIIGSLLIALPFVVIFIIFVDLMGLLATVTAFGLAALIVVVVVTGVKLVSS